MPDVITTFYLGVKEMNDLETWRFLWVTLVIVLCVFMWKGADLIKVFRKKDDE